MQEYFYHLADAVNHLLSSGEVYTAYYSGESTDFCRINHARIRQPGHVLQKEVTLRLIRDGRQAIGHVVLSGGMDQDLDRVKVMMNELRDQLAVLPKDPFLCYATENQSSEVIKPNLLPKDDQVLGDILASAQDLDLVGIWSSGTISRGFANSLGQRNWFESHSFNLDFSAYHAADKAVKSGYAGFEWDERVFKVKLDQVREHLDVVKRPAKKIDPGSYRVFLSPAAVGEVFDLLSWGSFGAKAQRTEQSSLRRLIRKEARLHPSFSLIENTLDGVSPNFDGLGFVRPDRVSLISEGEHRGSLASARSAREYGLEPTGANQNEAPEALDLAPGTLESSDILLSLGTGVMVNNLWYMNYSDRLACRMTGMTRFATFWVESGQVMAPLEVMRFDETLFRMFGDHLIGLTKQRDLILSSSTYDQRATSSQRLPGALIDSFTFTL